MGPDNKKRVYKTRGVIKTANANNSATDDQQEGMRIPFLSQKKWNTFY